MNFEEFNQFKLKNDPSYPLIPHYIINEEADFYIEPIFYSQLLGFKERHPKQYPSIITSLINRVIKNKKVVFIGDYENNELDIPGYIFLEITDITDPLQIFVEDKSRGSDYGD